MRLAQKLVLYALAVALIPLAATGFTLIRVSDSALRVRIQEHQQTAAIALAGKVSQAVEELARRVATVMELVDVTELGPSERQGVLRMLYRQSVDISITALMDIHGKPLAAPVHLESPAATGGELAGHPPAGDADVARFAQYLPVVTGGPRRPGEVLISPVYYPEGAAARVAVAVPCSFDASGTPRAVAGVEIALRAEVLRVEGVDTGPGSLVFVVDRGGRVILHPTAGVGSTLEGNGAAQAFLQELSRGSVRFQDGQGIWAAAFAPVGGLQWGVVVQQPEALAFASATQMRRQIMGWIFVTVAVVLATGLAFAGLLRRAIALLVAGARRFGEGELGQLITLPRADELGELASTMNHMASQLNISYQELEEWSRTLETKVEERTKELQDTQSQLLLQAKLAAIGQLGAGVAHEVNNPLAALLGHVQLLLRTRQPDDPDRASLQEIEAAAKRCRAITLNLLRFSERGVLGRTLVGINDVVREVLDIVQGTLSQAGLAVQAELADNLPPITADAGAISVVLINLINNARDATPSGGVVRVRTAALAEGVTIEVNDNGKGIPAENLTRIFDPFFTTKTIWTGVGLGLSVAYRIVSDHGGAIDVESTEGHGATFTVYLPKVPPPLTEPALRVGPRGGVLGVG